MTNLLTETLEAMQYAHKAHHEVTFVGSLRSGHRCTWEEFEIIANREYDAGYGCHEVALDLVITFTDGSWLERYEYDGSEGWVYKSVIDVPSVELPLKTVFCLNYETHLSEIN